MATMKLGSKAEAFQLEGHTWICTNELASDVTIEIGEMSFHLHKFPLLNKSGLLQKLITECNNGEGKPSTIQLHDIPGGTKAFELVAKFCYDIRMELNAHNVVYLRCAAEYLKMTEEYVGNNLISQTEALLTEVFSNWKDSIKVLEKCEYVLPQAEDLHIVNRCINSLATKACADPTLFAWPTVGRTSMKSPGGTALWNGICTGERKSSSSSSATSFGVADWWYQDVSFLSLPLFKRLIVAMESKGMKPESIAGSLMFYARRYLPGLNRSSSFRDGANNRIVANAAVSAPSDSDQRGLLEEIVAMLPMKKGVSSTKFLLGLLRTAMLLKASSSCRENLEMRVGTQLEEAALEDLLIPNLGYSVETLYDIDCVQRMLDHFMVAEQSSAATSPGIVDEGHLMGGNSSGTPMSLVAKLIDGYLAEVAPDVNLKFNKFQALATVIPDCARTLDDGIYRAIDIYLKSHPWLTDSEREQLCRLMNCQKLSLEACTHAAQNERLPLRVVVQVLFFEQLRLRTSIAGWFFVSDNLENPHGAHGSLVTQKNNGDGVRQTEITQENKDEDELLVSSEEMKVRVSELEKECLSMKHDIQKLGKHKSSWSLFSKLRLGSKSQPR